MYSKAGSEGEEDVRALGTFMRETILPSLFKAMKDSLFVYYDTMNITRDLHGQGVNLRYLGKLADTCTEDDLVFRDLIEEEMIARSAKHILRDILENEILMSAPGFVTTAFLNALVCDERKKDILITGKSKKSKKIPSLIAQTIIKQGYSVEKIWSLIDNDLKEHFHYELKAWKNLHMSTEQKTRLLRRVCQQCGICLIARDYSFTDDIAIHVEDIVEFVSHVKYAFTPTLDENVTPDETP